MICAEQPSSSSSANDQEFPALAKLKKQRGTVRSLDSPLPAYHPAKVTERRYQNEDLQAAGKRYDAQTRICMEIVKETGVEINLNTSKSNTLTAVLSGNPNKVAVAKQRLMAELRQQETIKINIPQEYHGYLIGRRGDRLREIQSNTMTRIVVPPSNAADPNTITITGPKQGITEAEQLIRETVERQAQQGFERLDIPKIFHPFICGPNNQRLDELRERTDTKINIPPRSSSATVITISGKRDGVMQAADEIRAVFDQVKSYKTIPVCVKKSQHHLVSKPRGSGLAEILAETGVSVEVPTDPISEEIILCGRPEDLGRALSMVYERAESSIGEEVHCPNRFHKLLIGKRGSALAELREGYERVKVDFGDNQDKIWIEGPPEEVEVIVTRLKTRIAELEATMAIDTIRVDPKYFRHIIGRQGANILRLCDHNVQIRLPTLERGGTHAADEIVIEGDPAGIEKTKANIQQLVQKLENEKCKDVIIEPRIQQLLCTGYKNVAPPIRLIYDTFPKVSVVWPTNQLDGETSGAVGHDNPSKSVVQLRGDRQQVDAAAERLSKLIKQVVEENFRQEIRIFKEFRPHIFGKGSSKIQKLLDETKTRIQYPNPSDGSDVFTIIGREENVQQAIRQIEDLQKKLANVKEVIVSIPSALTTKFAGDHAPSLRSICDQCEGVHMRFLNPRQKNPRSVTHVDVVMLGPPDALERAQKLIDKLNDRVAELCAEELVHVDPKFHGFLIGRQGATITRFRERHNVELIFPDRMETDPKLATEIRIVGPKDAVAKAKVELESLIKTIEDEVEHSVPVDPTLLHEILTYRHAFPQPELDRVRVIMPKTISTIAPKDMGEGASANVSAEPMGIIRLVGQKACVEAATEALQSMVSDIKAQVTKEFPLTSPNQFIVLDRTKSQFRDLERNYRVFIHLRRTISDTARDATSEAGPTTPTGCLVIIGRPERIDHVYEDEIRPLLPIEEEFPLAKEFHRNLISVAIADRPRRTAPTALSKSGKRIPNADTVEESSVPLETQSKAVELRQKHGVLIRLPPQHDMDANFVVLRGTPSQLEACKLDLADWVSQCEALKADRIARSYELTVAVPTRFISSLIALRPKLTAAFDVAMRFGPDLPPKPAEPPEADADHEAVSENTPTGQQISSASPASELGPVADEKQLSTVIFRGYQEKVAAAKSELEREIAKLKAQVTENLFIPAEVHPRLIGSRGYAIQKVMQDFKVRIEFPSRGAQNVGGDPNSVLVTGDEKDVDRACDYLIARANELMALLDSGPQTGRQKQYWEELFPSGGPAMVPNGLV
ncbi:hypothetical protein P879_07933 [Paragonimus westermani]|uniref:K Homology domain-containing protein n=1 Tax=Paragonimus westermani TaxID=34504 RepID=A0A8T0D6I8_9TREM|nr:hypothetical protein P879_07933 [Paragonimus westermani]